MGITLNAASLVVFAELFWNPGILVQAEDRCYRIGQRDVVNVHYLIAKKTADDCIWQMIKNKLEVLSQAGLNKTDFNETQHKHVTKQPGQKNILDYFEGGSETNDNSACDAIDEDLLRALEEAEREEMTSFLDNNTPQSNRFRPDQTDLNDVDDTKQSTADCLHSVTSDSSRLEQSSRKRENLSAENDDFDAFREPKRLKK
uniref:Helicase C-terminal domain-containing protein n=1 Tax=Ciona savignyi TaxID=51511 RepID=H2Z051_CIOSA